MHLPSGIPTLANLDTLKQDDLYRRHVQFNGDFLKKHSPAMASYGRHWGLDPFKLWSRRWEYPFVAQRLINFAETRPDANPLRILDAGSGVTYFPYYVVENVPRAEFICCDYDTSYAPMFEQINRDRGDSRVRFMQASLQRLPIDDQALDAICCISVLEHTDNYGEIVNEFARVLKPGGKFVLTFDLSLDGKFTLPKALAGELLGMVAAKFQFPEDSDPARELDRMGEDGILTTDYVRQTEPHLLPWSMPVRVYKAAHDLVHGKGWTGGFRSRTIYCLDVLKKSA
jgi:SAM-dependent methyltransferase